MKKIIFGVVVFLASAQFVQAAAYWSEYGKVLLTYPYSSGNIFIRTENMPDTNRCGSKSYVLLLDTNKNKNIIYTTLLTAMTTGQRVRYNSSVCSGSYPVINHVILLPPGA